MTLMNNVVRAVIAQHDVQAPERARRKSETCCERVTLRSMNGRRAA